MMRMLHIVRLLAGALAWLWPCACALAQQAPPDARADSLRRLAVSAPTAAEASDRWLDLSKHYRKSNLDSSQGCLERAMGAAARSGDQDRQQRCNMSRAALSWMQGHLDDAEARYRKAVAYWQGKRDSLEVARCLLNLGTVCQSAHKDQQASTYLKSALRLAQAKGEQLIAAQAAGSIATVSFQLGLPDSIAKYSAIAKAGFVALGDSANLARVHCNEGFYYLGLGMSYEARQPYLDALAYVAGTDEAGLKGEVHSGIAGLEYHVGNYSQAIEHYLKARDYFSQLKWHSRIADNHNTIGICFKRLGRLQTARMYFGEAYRLGDSLGNHDVASMALSHMGTLDREGGNHKGAIRQFHRSLDWDREAPRHEARFVDLQGLGRSHLALGAQDSATHYFKMAAEEALQRKDSLLFAETFLDMARVFMVQKRFDRALPQIEEGRAIYGRQRNAAGLQAAWSLTGECSEAMGDIPAALHAERMARQWQDSVQAFTANTQLLALEAKYWSERKQHALELAKQNEALQAKEAERAQEASEKLSAQRNLLVSALVLTLVFGAGLYWVNLKRRQNQLDRKLAELRLVALRAQMNPHFIFNALGSVQMLINTSAIREANLYLSKFAQLLRTTLERSDARVTTLEDEIEALRLYIDLEALRFKFQYSIEVDEAVEAGEIAVPTLLLQPLVENCVKHGIAAKPQSGRIRLAFSRKGDELCCVVEDNGVGRTGARKRSDGGNDGHRSFGLDITRERLSLLSPHRHDRLRFIDLHDEAGQPAGTRVEILLPLQPA